MDGEDEEPISETRMSETLDCSLDQNVLWASEKTRDDPDYFRRMAEQQSPRYLWIGCSDSRITANDVLRLNVAVQCIGRYQT